MERHGQHVGARVKDALGAVAVMQVDIEDRHARRILAQALRGDRRIVEEAEAAGDVGKGVMPGRAAQRVSRGLACQHRVGRLDRSPGAPAGAAKSLGRDRACGIGHVVAGLADRRGRIGTVAGDRVDVGDHFGRRALDALPARKDVLEEIEIFRRMDRGDRPQPEIFRPGDRQARGLGAGQQPLDALGLFRVGLRRAARQERFWVVTLLFVCIKGLHAHASLVAIGQRLESVVIGGADLVVVIVDKAQPRIEFLGAEISDVDREPHISAAAGAGQRRAALQQRLADAGATEPLLDPKILDVDALAAMPGREAAEIQAHAGIFSSDLGDQACDGGIIAEHMFARIGWLAADLVLLADEAGQRQDGGMDRRDVGGGGGADEEVGVYRHARPSELGALRRPPLSCRTSPPQGGRLAASASAPSLQSSATWRKADAARPISPLEGEMSGRTEGGNVKHTPSIEVCPHPFTGRSNSRAATAIASPRIDTISPT